MPTPSNRQVNITSAVFTPAPSGTPKTINTVQGLTLNKGGKPLQGSGDGDFYPTTSVTVGSAPSVSIKHQNGALLSIDEKSIGSFTWKSNDAENGVSSGCISFTLSNVNVVSHEGSQAHQNFSDYTLLMNAKSTDGVTSPLAFTIAA